MVIAWHDAAFTLPDAVLSPELMTKVLAKFKLQHKLKDTWTTDESKLLEKLFFVDEETMQGTSTLDHKKDANMTSASDEILKDIADERMRMKEMRDEDPSINDQAQKLNKNNNKI